MGSAGRAGPLVLALLALGCRSPSGEPPLDSPGHRADDLLDAAAPRTTPVPGPATDATPADQAAPDAVTPPADADPAPADVAGPPVPGVPSPLFLIVGGDLMFHDQIQSVAREHADGDPAAGWAWLLRELAPVRRRLEALGRTIFVANLESPIAEQREEPRPFPPRFNGPPEALAGFRAAGIDALTLANNHSYDQHRAGLAETVAAVEAAGFAHAGAGDAAAARAPAVLVERNPRVLLLQYLWLPQPPSDPADEAAARIAVLDERAEAEVRAAAADADALLVVVHWVGEFQSRPLPAWRDWTDRLVAAGAAAVVGHGPHVVGPVELRERDGRVVPVVFSVGNLVSNMGWGVHPEVALIPTDDSEFRLEARTEALAVLRVEPVPVEDGLPPRTTQWSLTGLWMVPLWLEDNRPLANRPGGPRREIFPRPLPWCLPDDPLVGCFAEASERWCRGRLDLLQTGRTGVLRTIGGSDPAPLAPCPPGADPYDPPPEFQPLAAP
jgi:poly-gamma-glutamate synthesis protein (capsule biosynthesis protein)